MSFRNYSLHGGALLALLMSPLVTERSICAAEYTIAPSISARAFFDDNLLMNTTGKIKSFGMELQPSVKAAASSDTWRYELDASLGFYRLEDDLYDSDDQNITFNAIRVTPTTIWQFTGRNQRASSRTTELDATGLVDPQAQRRDTQSFRPAVQWNLDAKNRLTFGMTVDNVHYDALSFDDYDNYGGDISYARQYTEKTSLELTAFGSLYKSENFKTSCAGVFFATDSGEFESETYGLRGGFRHQFSEQLNFGASVGRRQVASSAFVRTCFFGSPFLQQRASEKSGLVLDASLGYVGEKYKIDASLSRAVNPAGLGFLIESTDFSIYGEYQFAERLLGQIYIIGFDNKSVDDDVAFARNGVRVQPGFSWRFSERWWLNGGLRYRTVDSLDTLERKGLQTFVTVKYDFKPWRASR